MYRLLLITFIVIGFSNHCFGQKNFSETNKSKIISGVFLINKIDSTKSFYFIRAVNNKKTYQIISKKTELLTGFNKIELNKSDTIAVKDGYIVPIIPYKIKGLNYNYTTSNITSTSYRNDNNASTFYEIDTEKDTEILLTFNEPIKRNTFGLNFKHSAESYIPELYISED